MQTNFTADQLERPDIKEMESTLRKCVHCGFCLSACPTYSLLGDERDSPRGRIYLIKDMLETGGKSTPSVQPHIDRCLSCLACMSVCPSGVDYQHYVEFARSEIEQHQGRSWFDRLVRNLIAIVIPSPRLFRLSLGGARLAKPFAALLGRQLGAMVRMAPAHLPKPAGPGAPGVYAAEGERRKRVVLLAGCAQQVLRPSINEATIRLLTRLGCEVVVPKQAGCCGALVHHMGRDGDARDFAAANIAAWTAERDGPGLDAIVVNASGCGTEVKDYGHLFQNDDRLSAAAGEIAALALDVSELLAELGLPAATLTGRHRVTYHDACSLLHGQKIKDGPRELLRSAGFEVQEIPGAHFCCGSAGSYNLLQDEMADKLKQRRQESIRRVESDFLATGNIGCQVQLQAGLDFPVVHTVELLDWATGGPQPTG